MKNRRNFLATASAAVIGGALPSVTQAQAWPSRPIKIVVPFPPAGSTDVMGRLLANELSQQLGQPVLVENKAGANGNIGSDFVSKAAPDGYTLLLSGVGSNAINYTVYPKMAYADSDFTHITLLATGPNVLVANLDFPAKNFAEFLALAKANPGKYSHASSGTGASGHLSMEMLKQAAGLSLVHVPYKGGPAAINDLIGGQIPLLFINQDSALPFVRSGKLRALAVTSVERNPAYPETPAVAESGFAGFSAVSWFGLSGPAGLSKEVVKRLSDASVKAFSIAAIRQQLQAVGFVVAAGTPEQFSEFVTSEIAKWGKAARAANVLAE